MKYAQFRSLLFSDIYRYNGHLGWSAVLSGFMKGLGEHYSVWMRLSQYVGTKGTWALPLKLLIKYLHRRAILRFGFEVYGDKIGPGLYLGHFGGVTISSHAHIGSNCNISQGVTIGVANGGKHPGYPIVGNNVYIGPGAKIFGGIKIGDNVAIGANAVVNKDIPENSVVVGIPGKVISFNGSKDYIHNIWASKQILW